MAAPDGKAGGRQASEEVRHLPDDQGHAPPIVGQGPRPYEPVGGVRAIAVVRRI